MNNINMIFGAPGCGKTYHLMYLLSKELQNFAPEEIAYVSFTKKGSYEGRDRAIKEFGFNEIRFPYFRTIHSLAFRALQVSKYEIISKRHYKEFSKAMGMNFLGYYTEELVNNDDKYLFQISLKKNNPIAAKKLNYDIDYRLLDNIELNYTRYKHEMGIKDFDDLIINFIKANTVLPIKVAFIDEAQDLTSLQWEFCKIAFRDCEKIYIAGDDDQAIYEWSGADIDFFLSLTKTSNNILILDKSYRLRENILEFSKKIIRKISIRVEKQFSFDIGEGNIYFYNSLEDIPINSEETYYLLSRNNLFLKEFKTYIMKMGLPFNYKNKPFIKPELYNTIKKYEYLRKYDEKVISTSILLQRYLRKDISKPYPPWFDAFELEVDEANYYRSIFQNKTNIENNKITISTIHGVKGGEADNIILKLDMTRNVYQAFVQANENINAELRCLYVGVTRAKKNLHIIYSSSKFGYDELIKELIG